MAEPEDKKKISIKDGYRLILRILKLAFQIRPTTVMFYFFGASMEIGGSIGSIYATARLGAYLARFIANGQSDHIWFWLWVDIFLGIIISLGFFVMSYCKRLLYFRYVHWATNTYLRSLCNLDIDDFFIEDIRNKINKVQGAYTWQISNLSDSILELIYAVLRFIAITVVVAQITWWLVPVIALFLIPTLITERRVANLLWFVWDQKGDERHVFWGLDYLIRQVKGQMELRSTQATNFVLNKINSMNTKFYDEQERKFKETDSAMVGTKLLETAGTTIGAIVVLRKFLNHSISLERYFFLSGALLRVGGALNNIFGTLSRMQEPLLFAEDFFKLADMKPRIIDKPNAIKLDTSKPPEIKIENVSFAYPRHKELVFEDLNLTIKPGEHVAVVGENGAGKSTLIKLLMRFYVPNEGRILINGVNINDIAIDSLYEQIATLFQDFNQYPLPISENITVGRSINEPDIKKRNQAAEFASIDSIVKKYKHGWETVLDSSFKKGVEPSGGQWQRVALARAFYRQAGLLILDEPTSAIDAKAEYEIFNNIFEQYKDRTAVIISHRFSTVRRADRIIVIDQGKIVEEGDHKKLMKINGVYATLFNHQAEGYRD